MTNNKRANNNKMMKLTFNEMALVRGGKDKPKEPEKPKMPKELISQPYSSF